MARIDLAASLGDARARVAAETPVEEREPAMFARLTRKDTRIRADQDAALTALARTVMRRRARKVERITENTLIRIAIDLLLSHADELRGSTEDELRKSVTSALRDLRTSDVAQSGPADATDSGSSDLRGSEGSGVPDLRVSDAPASVDAGPRQAAPGIADTVADGGLVFARAGVSR
ncbi:hypothetical protein [Microbacterium trichothecenolyticum]|uniref:Uncharacterized protein n=1 Tax=Microbacterium trichothecenolyticum TaxID=69370 RepID=A0A0M2H6F1_MICTR|nr:hypothetical protein [Microbacterium trichothecenolyticum]KJL40157.1 hypothetical protein RS82_03481 [Microbacterium trichothecenolyticum]